MNAVIQMLVFHLERLQLALPLAVRERVVRAVEVINGQRRVVPVVNNPGHPGLRLEVMIAVSGTGEPRR
ncbi:MAG: hypothetical protein HZA91_05720 [Verrucomicrobia bacterium]|nr:hypothetical protein [Verrucomicrobiota bacterium]